MISSILANWFKMDVGDGAFYAVFGFVFVFLGIALLVGIFTVVGIIMKKVNARGPKKRKIKSKVSLPEEAPVDEEDDPEIVAAITAAIMAMYEGENRKCDFVVRRIKRL